VNKSRSAKYELGIFLLLLTAAALLTHGYHPYAEDAEIYLPGIELILNHHLFPVGREFFQSHASMTLFPNLVAWSLRLTHLPFETGLFIWHILSIFLFLLACWELSGMLFSSARARWGSVCLTATLLTIPVSGTALYIMDQYLNPRNLAAFAGVFALTRMLQKRYLRSLGWLIFAASVHPLMWVFPSSFCALWIVLEKLEGRLGRAGARGKTTTWACLLLFSTPLIPSTSPTYHEAAKLHANHYIQHWEWYEWLGLVGPLILLWYFARIAQSRQWSLLARVCRVFIIYEIIYLAIALLVDLPARFESLARLQPLRSLHLLYVFLFLCMGGLIGEYLLKDSLRRWLALFIPLSIGMFAAQRSLFPESAHVEWPGRAEKNPWGLAFVWIRQNAPVDAVFALDPDYMHIAGEDEIGFRALAQRSRLADAIKDNGVVSMFPPLADEWWAQVQAQSHWNNLRASDFPHLKEKYGVTWVVLEQPGLSGLDCPYQNAAVIVCDLP
jgi:hypothetical protein